MRLARYIPTAVVGLASFAGQATISQLCCAWDSVPASAIADSNDPQDGGYITDHAVQQAGYSRFAAETEFSGDNRQAASISMRTARRRCTVANS